MDAKAPREFSDKSRDKMADKGVAMPDGSYPIPDKDALRRAIQSFGRAKNPAATKRHIVKRARALGATAMLPEGWSAKGSIAAGHAAQGADILEDLYGLIGCEADEPDQLRILQTAADAVTQWLALERQEIGKPGDSDELLNPYGKAFAEIKAEPMDSSRLAQWLEGKIPRRKLVIPFTGPLPGGKAGLDLDGEYFDEETDLYGPFPALKASRERIVDWHHDAMYKRLGADGDPTGWMKGALLGREVWDEQPETAGLWADWWINAGEKRKALIEAIERRGGTLYGSSEPVQGFVKKADDGHILVWPVIRDTVTTSPQNTHAAIPPLKALLAADIPDDVGIAALKAALVGIDDPATLGLTSRGGGATSRRGGKGSGKAAFVLTDRDRELAREAGLALRSILSL